ncbi:MAG TPA: cupredoxin domain-containing protein [Solirubrobacteraceae bacterium]|nr:cupredoxin domain-containing protein [Solirubrobacteraceae bacterium]
MRLRPSFAAIITCLGLAACAGSSSSSSTQATATPAAASAASSAQTTGSTPAATTSAGATTTTTTSTSAPPEVPKAKKNKHHGATHAASQGAHVETDVTVNAAGDLVPPVVSVPAGVGVELHVTNHGSAADTVALSVPSHPSVHVAPGASATLETGGLKDGTYRIIVNGTPRGQLMIGAQGGP